MRVPRTGSTNLHCATRDDNDSLTAIKNDDNKNDRYDARAIAADVDRSPLNVISSLCVKQERENDFRFPTFLIITRGL